MILVKAYKDVLLRPLQQVSGIVEKRHTLPILSNVLLRKHAETLCFVSTDIEMQMTSKSPIGYDQTDVSTTVSSRKLLDILKSLPNNDEVSMSLTGAKLTIAQRKTKFALQTLSAQEFPTITESAVFPARVQLTQSKFKKLLHLVSFSMAQQDIRYYLNGMLLVIDGQSIRAAATDGHRLAYAHVEDLMTSQVQLAEESTKLEIIVPRKAIHELLKTLSDDDALLDIYFSNNQAKFVIGDLEIISKLIEGKFPDYQRVIPQNHQKHVFINRELLLGALQRVSILTTEKFKGVRLVLDTNVLRISATNAEQEEAQEELNIDYSAETIDIGFNVQYLIDVLTNLASENVQLSFQDQTASALLTSEQDTSFRYVVMPMRI